MKELPNIGKAELEILNYISDHYPISVREVADHLATTKGIVRTTVLNVMERLRQKGFLHRKKGDGIFQYSPRMVKEDLLKNLVKKFINTALDGSVTPFVAYLSEHGSVSQEELSELRKMIQGMENQQRKEKP